MSELNYDDATRSRIPVEVCEECIKDGDIVLIGEGLTVEVYRKEENGYAHLATVEKISELLKFAGGKENER